MGFRDWFRRTAAPAETKDSRPTEQKLEGPAILVSPSLSGQPIWTDWTVQTAVTYGMKSSSWVFVAIRKRMSYSGAVPWHAEKWNARTGQWDRDDNCPMAELIAQPNPFQEWNDLQRFLVAHLILAGNAGWFKNRTGLDGRGPVKRLWVVSPDAMRPIPSATEYLSGYELDLGGAKVTLAPSEIIHFQHHDPANQWLGLGNIQAGAKAVDVDVEAANYQRNSLGNMATPSGIFTPKETLNQKQWETAQTALEASWAGAVKAGKILVATGDGTFQSIQMTPKDMMFADSRQLGAIEICAICEVQPTLVGVVEHPTYANFSTSRRVQWEDTELPHLSYVRDVLNMRLAPEFGPGYRFNFDVSRVPALMEVFASRVDTAVKLFQMSVPLNDIVQRLDLGMRRFDHGDVPMMASGTIPADGTGLDGFDAPPAQDEPAPAAADEDE